MTDEEREAIEEAQARKLLDEALDKFVADVRDVIQRKVNDSISVDEVINGFPRLNMSPEKMTEFIVLGWVRRIMMETIAESFGEKYVARAHDDIFYQICSQHIGPENFGEVAVPYNNGKGNKKWTT